MGEIPDDGRVIYEEPYLSTYPQWEAPQEGTPPFRTMTKPILVGGQRHLLRRRPRLGHHRRHRRSPPTRPTFFDPHVSIGLVSGREIVRLARVLPTNIAMRMALTGKHERMGAQRAYDLGLVSEVVEHDRPRSPGPRRSPPS